MKKAEILETIPGIGKCLVNKFITFLPELGNKDYNIKQLAAIVVIAPYLRDSGNKNGKRFTRGGRKIPRDAIYMAVLSSKRSFCYLKNLYTRLVNNFKPKKVAIVACIRKLLEICHKLLIVNRPFIKNIAV